MPRPLNKRTYDSSSRRTAAEATRRSILTAARRVFLEKGYAATTMPSIAKIAGISLDTVYATVGKKPALFRLLLELAISGGNQPVPAEERAYVRAIREEPDAAKKLRIYAAALGQMQPRLAPLIQVLQGGALVDRDLETLWKGISQRRARNMQLLAQDLSTTGRLRRGLSVSRAADIIWSMNSPEFYSLLVKQRRWAPKDFEEWLAEAWIRLLLEP